MSINPDAAHATLGGENTFAGSPAMHGFGRHYEVDVTCRGSVNPQTGYFINIKTIDRAVWKRVAPLLHEACASTPGGRVERVLPAMISALNDELDGAVACVRLRLSPYYCVEMNSNTEKRATIRQSFEFAASHRLNVDALSAEENLRLFGKCNHANGHGHNYRVEPCVEVVLDTPSPFTLCELEHLTSRLIIDRFDHKHLNLDTPEFAQGTGVNPSVENIAMVCYRLLKDAIAAHPSGARLTGVTVWETEKTSCTYPAE